MLFNKNYEITYYPKPGGALNSAYPRDKGQRDRMVENILAGGGTVKNEKIRYTFCCQSFCRGHCQWQCWEDLDDDYDWTP
jgi:hypothetical protein